MTEERTTRVPPDEFRRTIDAVEAVVRRPEVVAAIARLSPEGGAAIDRALDRMRRKVAYVAAIGAQGTGKSSLLNALLFSRRVLPVGEGVTTSLACYVEHAQDDAEHGEVVMAGERIRLAPLDRESLLPFLTETQNPGNSKDVQSVRCYTHAPLLTKSTVFVDTPGLGSLVGAHDRETMAFVRDLALGIFVVRTTPPLTQSEATFLDDIWPLCREYIFVQNWWGESDAEVEQSRRFNENALAEIARKHGDRRPVEVLAVDVHRGLDGLANDDHAAVAASKLPLLIASIQRRVDRGGQRLELVGQAGLIATYLRSAQRAAEEELALLRRTPSNERRIAEQLLDEEDAVRELERSAAERRETFLRQCRSARDGCLNRIRQSLEELHAEYQRTLRDTCGDAEFANEFVAAIKRKYRFHIEDLSSQLQEIGRSYVTDTAREITDLDVPVQPDAVDVGGTHLAEIGADLAKWIGGTGATAFLVVSVTAFGSTLSAGATVVSGTAAAAAAVPVAGWLVALGLMAAGVVIKEVARDKRRAVLRAEIGRILDETMQTIRRTVRAEVDAESERIATEMEGLVAGVTARRRSVASRGRAHLAASDDDRRRAAEMLTQMLEDLQRASADVTELVRRDAAPLT